MTRLADMTTTDILLLRADTQDAIRQARQGSLKALDVRKNQYAEPPQYTAAAQFATDIKQLQAAMQATYQELCRRQTGDPLAADAIGHINGRRIHA